MYCDVYLCGKCIRTANSTHATDYENIRMGFVVVVVVVYNKATLILKKKNKQTNEH